MKGLIETQNLLPYATNFILANNLAPRSFISSGEQKLFTKLHGVVSRKVWLQLDGSVLRFVPSWMPLGSSILPRWLLLLNAIACWRHSLVLDVVAVAFATFAGGLLCVATS